MTDPILYDISADNETRTKTLIDALLTGRPLTIHDSTDPDTPPVSFCMELTRTNDTPTPEA